MKTTASTNHWPGLSFYETDLGHDRVYCPPLTGDADHQVLIIGAGLAGLNTAWSLTERGVTDIGICEDGQPGEGASGRNGGFVFAGYSLPNQTLVKKAGVNAGRMLHGWTREAVRLVRHRINTLSIDCHPNDAGVLLADWFKDDQALRQFQRDMHDTLGFKLDWVDPDECCQLIGSTRYGSALHEPDSFHFHPLRYVNALVAALQRRGVKIYGDSKVHRLERSKATPTSAATSWIAQTGAGQVCAEQVIVTTGGYDTRLWRHLGQAIQPIATYIATTPPLGDQIHALIPKQHAVYDTRFAFDYYRPLPDTRLLWGGRISIQARSPEEIKRVLKRDLMKVFPQLESAEFDHAWGGWMGYTRHQMPLLGQDASGLWHATGFGGHGMAPTTLAGEVIAEAMVGDAQRLNAYQQWQPVWAGGLAGRAWAQGTYWALSCIDWLRDRSALSRAQRG